MALDGTLDIWLKLFGGFNSPIDYCVELAKKVSIYFKKSWNTEYLVNPEFCSSMFCIKLPQKFINKCLKESNLDPPYTELSYNEAEIIQNYLYFQHNIEVPIKSIQNELYVRISCHIYNKFSDYEYLGNVINCK